jgi:hypothetical protein
MSGPPRSRTANQDRKPPEGASPTGKRQTSEGVENSPSRGKEDARLETFEGGSSRNRGTAERLQDNPDGSAAALDDTRGGTARDEP